MSDQYPPTSQSPGSGKPPIVRLPQWVNVVLVLILLGSCGAAVDRSSSAGEIASQVSTGQSGDAASAQDVEDLCRLLGAVAVKQGVDVDKVMSHNALTRCHELALNPATP
jgi:hypothetical protein